MPSREHGPASEPRYQALVDATNQVAWLMDDQGLLDGGRSQGWLELTGQRPGEASGAPWLSRVHPEDRDAVACTWEQAVEAGEVFECELRLRDASERYRTISVRCVPVRDPGGRVVEWVGAARDVTQARTAERLAGVRARQQLEVAELGRLALKGAAVDELLARALGILVESLGADSAAVLQSRPSGEELVLRASHGWDGAPIGSGTIPSGDSLAGLVLAADGPVIVDDVAGDPRFEASDLLRQTGAASAVATVIRWTPSAWGVLGVFSAGLVGFARDDASFVRAIANVLASALERGAAEEALRASQARLELALDAGRLGTWDRVLASREFSWSPALEEAFGLEPGSFPGTEQAFQALVHPEDLAGVRGALEAALEGSEPYDVEYRCVRPDGTVGWISSQGHVLRSPDGEPVQMVGLARDVTDRKRHEEALAFLAEASEALSGSLDFERTLTAVARLAVPRLADGCVIDVVEHEHGHEAVQVTVCHADPEQERRILELERLYPTGAGEPGYVDRALATREAKLVRRVDEAFLLEIAHDAEHLHELRRLGLCSALFSPLTARGRTFGVITLLTDRSGRRLGQDDLVLATDLARHAALALDNARLYQQRSHVASTLQRSLLPPELPEITGVELAARYHATAAGAEVGGDFYDAFPLGVDAYGIVIGDVCGKGPEAAAVTGLARHTVRAASVHLDSPAEVLGRLNEAVYEGYDGSTFCTVVCGRIDRAVPGVRFRLSSGGHPLPLRLQASGAVAPIGGFGTLVGIFPSPDFDDVEVRLEPGDAVLLYTDGLAEGLAGRLIQGEQRLRSLLAECTGGSAEEIAARVEEAVAEAGEAAHRDDIAFLVVRVLDER